MAIEIREFVGAESVHFKQAVTDKSKINLTEWHAESMIDEDSIMVDIEGIHSKLTRNYTFYEPDCLKESVPLWTQPYERPVIMHHNERDGVIIGRIKAVEYTDKQTRSGTPALVFTTNIPHEEGKKGIKNGTLSTVSIGAIAHDVRCSICGTNIAEDGLCEHEKGETYNGQLCYWIIKKMEPKELSYVIVPSDVYAHNLRVYKPQQNKLNKVSESTNQSEVKKSMLDNPFADLIAETKADLTESAKEEVKKEDKKEEEVPAKEEPKKEEKKAEEKPAEEPKKVDIDEEVKKDDEGEINEEGEKNEPKDPESEKKSDEKEEDEKESDEDTQKLIKELEKKVKDLESQVNKLHKEKEAESKLREAAEEELLSFRAEKKKGLIEKINSLRSNLNLKEMDSNMLMESSDDSLSITLKNLQEFSEANKTFLGIPQVKSNVAVSEEADNTNKVKSAKDVKESTEDSNIDFVKEYTDIFSKIWN